MSHRLRADGGGVQARPATRRRRRWPWVVLVVVVVVGVYAGVSALRLVGVDHQLHRGVAAVGVVRAELHGTDLTDGALEAPVTLADDDFSSAHRTMSSAWWDPIEVLPVLGRQLASVRALTTGASTTVGAGHAALDRVQALLAAPHATPAQRTGVLAGLAGTVGGLHARLVAVDLGPRTDLLPELAHERDTFSADLATVDASLARTAAASSAISSLFEGPSTYLVLADNNAEMRDGSGMPLQVGTITFDQGRADAGPFTDAGQLSATQPQVPVTGDLAARWASLDPGKEWRDLDLSPQFPLNAPVAAAMWAARGGGRVQGVLSLDVPALSDLLSVTGPVTVAGTTYDAADVEQELLVGQYVGLGTGAANGNGVRRAALGALAAATLTHLETTGQSVGQLVDALAAAAAGRHIQVWSADPSAEAAWQVAGVSGALPPDGLLLGLINEGANKLDPFQHISATLAVVRAGADSDATVTVTVDNTAPSSLSPYASLGNHGPRYAYNGALSLDLPSYAGTITATGGGLYQTAGADGTTDQVAVDLYALTQGASRTVTFHFRLLGAHGVLQVQPSARVPPTSWTFAPPPGTPGGSRTFTDATATTLSW